MEKSLADAVTDSPVPLHHVWFMYDKRFIAVENIADYFLENRLCIEKVNTYSMPQELCEEIYEALTAMPCVKHTRAGVSRDLEFSHCTLDKTKAIEALLEKLGIDFEEVFSVGDSSSDLEMLRVSGISVAMGNGIEGVTEVAKYIGAPNTEDGVAKAIEQYVLTTSAELPSIQSYKKSKPMLVCIDSDGCALDTMEVKHKECFCTAFIECFGLQGISKYAREAWDFTNLYSKTRGFYRMKTLIMSIELLSKRREVMQRGYKMPDITPLVDWCNTYKVLSDATLREYAKTHDDEIIKTTLEWSAEVNRRIARLVKGVPPFPFVCESLAKVSQYADVAVVSATPTAALEAEWSEHGIKQHTNFICGQEYGSKKAVISELKKHYGEENVLMIGDALGDYDAACAAGASFYPICPADEDGSWKQFHDEVAQQFISGNYTQEVQNKYVSKLNACLADIPLWDSIG